jgi:membrane-associated protease RseP (regulator of RpoE activity)
MIINAKINGKGPYRLIFDVGSPVTLVSNKAGREAKLIKDDAPKLLLFGARGEAEVEDLQVGPLLARDVPVIVMDHPVVKALGQILGKPIDGLVGHSFFARYKTTIDYQAKTMAFVPVENQIRDFFTEMPDRLMGPKKAKRIVLAPAALWGFVVDPKPREDALGVTITQILPNSPAATAGLQPGDLLLELDGRWTTSLADTYSAAAQVQPGQSVLLKVRRNNAELDLNVTPKPGF